MNWNKQVESKKRRLNAVQTYVNKKTIDPSSIVSFLETIIQSGDRVVLEGCNQKQANFLAKSLVQVNSNKINNLNMIMPAVSLDEHLDLFDNGIAAELNFAYSGKQAKRLTRMIQDKEIKIGAIHTYLEMYARMFVDLTPDVCLIAADKADKDGNLYTGYNTEETPILAEAAAFKNGIVIAQVDEIVDHGSLPRVDIPGDWIDFIVESEEKLYFEPLFTRDPEKIKDHHILMAMMVIKGIYAKHNVRTLNHGVGYNAAAIELLLPTFGEDLGLKGKICTYWILNPHPTLIPAIEAGWVQQIYSFGGELGMFDYTKARSDVFFTGKDGSMSSNRTNAQLAGLYGIDLFIGATLQVDYQGNSSTVTASRLTGFGGAPNMGNMTSGRRHTSKAWNDMRPMTGSLISGKKLVVQMVRSSTRFGPSFVPELDAVKIAKEAGMDAPPVMIYGEDVTHMVTEQGIAYLYLAENTKERSKLLAAIAQGTPLGDTITAEELAVLRKQGKVVYPEDLSIDVDRANKSLLAAKSLEEIVDISGGLYSIPDIFKK